ncbi:hypothetical protein EVAR_47881_1 [Eumeta japonica]|uniref:Uncharacterized protein n=1 Tax=Eumeta variegata TaxID=151549 RepID=A0A4C1Y7M9_EUMVA|nr:hypothetical protein EVAR_47881_1 [Eumeta japonica]
MGRLSLPLPEGDPVKCPTSSRRGKHETLLITTLMFASGRAERITAPAVRGEKWTQVRYNLSRNSFDRSKCNFETFQFNNDANRVLFIPAAGACRRLCLSTSLITPARCWLRAANNRQHHCYENVRNQRLEVFFEAFSVWISPPSTSCRNIAPSTTPHGVEVENAPRYQLGPCASLVNFTARLYSASAVYWLCLTTSRDVEFMGGGGGGESKYILKIYQFVHAELAPRNKAVCAGTQPSNFSSQVSRRSGPQSSTGTMEPHLVAGRLENNQESTQLGHWAHSKEEQKATNTAISPQIYKKRCIPLQR